MQARRLIFWSTFLGGAGLLAAYAEFAPRPEDAVVLPVAPRPATARMAGPAGTPVAPEPQAGAASAPAPLLAASAGSLFAAQSWERKPPPPPPAPPPPAASPAPAAAPPLPFRFMGRLEEDGKVKVFLQNGERLYAASVGDVLEGNYRLVQIEPTQLTFLYLPLEQPQTIALGRAS